MAGPGKQIHDLPKGDQTVVEKDDSNPGSDEEQLPSLLNQSDNAATEHVASQELGNAVAASEQWNNESHNGIAERNAAPFSPTPSHKEAFEQMRFDLDNHRINDLKIDDVNKSHNANKNSFFHQSKSTVELSKLSSSVGWYMDPSGSDDIVHACLKLAAQNDEKDDPTLKGMDEVGGDEYRESMQARLATETGGHWNRKDNSYFAERGGYTRKRGSPSHRGRGGIIIRKRYPPRRRRSLPPSTQRPNSVGTADESILRPPSPVFDPVRAAQLAEAQAFQAEISAPKSPRGRGKSFVPHGNFGKHKVISPTASKPLAKLVPFKTTSKISPAPKSASGGTRPLSIAAEVPSSSNGRVIRQPVSTKFDKYWFKNAGAVLRKTSSTKPSSSNSSRRQSLVPSFRSESARQSAHQKAVGNSSRGTKLILRTASIREQFPEELLDDLYEIYPYARSRLPQNDSRTLIQPSLQRDNSFSSFGRDLNVTTRSVLEVPPSVSEEPEGRPQDHSDLIRLYKSSALQSSPRRAAQELMELNQFAWVEEPGIPQPNFILAQEHDNEDMAAAGNALQHDDLSGGRSDESSMLIDFSSPRRDSTMLSAPAINLSGGNAVVGAFVMPPSLMDDSLGMEDTTGPQYGGMEIESASPVNTTNPSRVSAVTTAGCQERRLARSLVGGPGRKLTTPTVAIADVGPLSWQQSLLADAASSHDGKQTVDAGSTETFGQGRSGRIVYAIDEMVALRGMTSPELVANVVDHMKMARERAQAEADQSRQAAERAHAEAAERRKAAERAKDHDAYRQWGSPYPPPRGGGPQMPEELTTPVKNTIKNELELARKGFTPSRPFSTPVKRKQAYGTTQSRLLPASTSVEREQNPSGQQKTHIDVSQCRPLRGSIPEVYTRTDSYAFHSRNTDRYKPGPASNMDAAKEPAVAKKVFKGLGDSRWASPLKNAATTVSDSQAAVKPAGLRKPSGGLADSRWASPKKPIASAYADDYLDDESFASHKSHKLSPVPDLSRGRQLCAGFWARRSVVDENVSPSQRRTSRGLDCFDGADDESSSPPSCRRSEPISPLRSRLGSDKVLRNKTQNSIVARAIVNADRAALADTTNHNGANSVSIAGSPKRRLPASAFRLADVHPVSLQQTLLADAQMFLIHEQPQPQHDLALASAASPSRQVITSLSSLKSFQDFNMFNQQRQHATHDNGRKLADQQPQQVHADTSQLEKQLYANAMLFARIDQQPRFVRPLPSDAIDPRGPPPVLHARRSIALLLDYLFQSQTPILIGGAYVPVVNNPTQIRRAKYVLRGAPWVESASATVRASIYLCENNGEYSEEVGTLDGPPADANGNLWFADLFAAIDNLSPLKPDTLLRGGVLVPSNIQLAGVNSLGQHSRLESAMGGGHSAISGAIAYTAYQPAPGPVTAPRLAGSLYEYALNSVTSIDSRNFVLSRPMDRSHALRFANPSPPVPSFVTARPSPESPPRVSRAIPIRHPENVPAAAPPQPRPTKSRFLERNEISAIISAESAQPCPPLTSILASGAMMARSQNQSSSTLSVQIAPFVPIRNGRPSAAIPIRRPEDVLAQSPCQPRPSSAGDAGSSAMARSQSQSSQSSSNLSIQSAPFAPAGSRGPSAVITAHAWAQRDLNTSAVVGSNTTDGIRSAMRSPIHQNTNSNRGGRRNNRGGKLSAFNHDETPQATAVTTPSQVSPWITTPPPAANMAASNINGSSQGDVVANATSPANGPQSWPVPQPPLQASVAQTTPSLADTTLPYVNELARGDNDSPSPAPHTPPPRRPEDVPVRQPRGPPTNNISAANNFAAMSYLLADDIHSLLPTDLQLIMLSQRQGSP